MLSQFWKAVTLTVQEVQLLGVHGFLVKKVFSLLYGARFGNVIRQDKMLQLQEMRWDILPMRLLQSIL